jgi:hypothetical protein
VRLHRLAGPWPETDASTQANLARALRAQPACLVDGILAGASPEVVAAAVESGHAVTLVVHLPISDELGLDPARRERYAALEDKRCAPRPGWFVRATGVPPSCANGTGALILEWQFQE